MLEVLLQRPPAVAIHQGAHAKSGEHYRKGKDWERMSTDAAYHNFVPSFGHLGCYPDETHGMGFGLWRHVDKKLSPMTKSNDCGKREEHICGPPGMHQGLGHIHFTGNGSATLQANSLAPGGAKCVCVDLTLYRRSCFDSRCWRQREMVASGKRNKAYAKRLRHQR